MTLKQKRMDIQMHNERIPRIHAWRRFKIYPSAKNSDPRYYGVTIVDYASDAAALARRPRAMACFVCRKSMSMEDDNCLGKIFIPRLSVNIDVSAHEIMHATSHYVRTVCKRSLANKNSEEPLAETMGRLMRQFWEKF